MKQYKSFIKDECYIYWLDPWTVFYYYSINYIQRYIYNYYDDGMKYSYNTFKKNMTRALTNYCNLCVSKGIELVRNEALQTQNYAKQYKPKIYDTRTNKDLNFHIEYIWQTSGHNPCDDCSSKNGRILNNPNMIRTHWNCKCTLEEHIWYEDDDGNIMYENYKTL